MRRDKDGKYCRPPSYRGGGGRRGSRPTWRSGTEQVIGGTWTGLGRTCEPSATQPAGGRRRPTSMLYDSAITPPEFYPDDGIMVEQSGGIAPSRGAIGSCSNVDARSLRRSDVTRHSPTTFATACCAEPVTGFRAIVHDDCPISARTDEWISAIVLRQKVSSHIPSRRDWQPPSSFRCLNHPSGG